MLKEHDRVVLTEDIPDKGLQAGDIGAIIDISGDGRFYMLEFVAYNGDTYALADVTPSQVRPVSDRDIPHARRIVA